MRIKFPLCLHSTVLASDLQHKESMKYGESQCQIHVKCGLELSFTKFDTKNQAVVIFARFRGIVS